MWLMYNRICDVMLLLTLRQCALPNVLGKLYFWKNLYFHSDFTEKVIEIDSEIQINFIYDLSLRNKNNLYTDEK